MSLFRRMQIRIKSKLCRDRQNERQETGDCPFNKPENIFDKAGACKKECPLNKKTCHRWDICFIAKQYSIQAKS